MREDGGEEGEASTCQRPNGMLRVWKVGSVGRIGTVITIQRLVGLAVVGLMRRCDILNRHPGSSWAPGEPGSPGDRPFRYSNTTGGRPPAIGSDPESESGGKIV